MNFTILLSNHVARVISNYIYIFNYKGILLIKQTTKPKFQIILQISSVLNSMCNDVTMMLKKKKKSWIGHWLYNLQIELAT